MIRVRKVGPEYWARWYVERGNGGYYFFTWLEAYEFARKLAS